MKIRRFVAKDIRTALINIKDELGADAVIMSNKKIPEGVELMAAIDYNQAPPQKTAEKANEVPVATLVDIHQMEEMNEQIQSSQCTQNQVHNKDEVVPPVDSLSALLNRDVQQSQNTLSKQGGNANQAGVASDSTQLTDVVEINDEESIEMQLKNFTERLRHSTPEGVIEAPQPLSHSEPEADVIAGNNTQFGTQAKSTLPEQPSIAKKSEESHQFSQIKAEMASIRALLEHQMSGLMWQNLAQKDPQRAVLTDRLLDLGLSDIIADQISGYVQEIDNKELAWAEALNLLSEQLNTTKNDIVHRGGVVALVGPSGVGKTTTIAKLASRFSQIHGKDEVVLISTDTYRIAGFEQLSIYGEMIGCRVELAKNSQVLDDLLLQYESKKLILIDTAGMSQRDLRLSEHLSSLVSSDRVKIRNYLVLSATSQHQVMQENVDHFKKIPLSACIYTKLDESVSIGEILSISIQNGLPIAYLTDGQKVPEDIKVANTEKLVQLADNMATKLAHNSAVYKNHRPMASEPFISKALVSDAAVSINVV